MQGRKKNVAQPEGMGEFAGYRELVVSFWRPRALHPANFDSSFASGNSGREEQ